MEEDFSVPNEFKRHSENLFKRINISNREFVDFCVLGVSLVDSQHTKIHKLTIRDINSLK